MVKILLPMLPSGWVLAKLRKINRRRKISLKEKNLLQLASSSRLESSRTRRKKTLLIIRIGHENIHFFKNQKNEYSPDLSKLRRCFSFFVLFFFFRSSRTSVFEGIYFWKMPIGVGGKGGKIYRQKNSDFWLENTSNADTNYRKKIYFFKEWFWYDKRI